MTSEQSLKRAEELLERLEHARQELAGTQDPDRAIEILSDLAQIAKEVETELTKAKREVDDENA